MCFLKFTLGSAASLVTLFQGTEIILQLIYGWLKYNIDFHVSILLYSYWWNKNYHVHIFLQSSNIENGFTLCVCVCTRVLSCVWFFAMPWTIAHEAPLSMEFVRQEYRSRLLFPAPGDLPHPGTEPSSLKNSLNRKSSELKWLFLIMKYLIG